MEIDTIHRHLSEIGRNGLAILTFGDLRPVFMNETFKTWFGVTGDFNSPDWTMLPELEEQFAGLEPGVSRETEMSVKVRRRTLSLSVHITSLGPDANSLVLVEVQNNTKIKEMESMIDSYSKMVERNERSLKREREKAERLLLNVMPRAVFEELRDYGVSAPTRYEEASVLMLDFVAFTEMSIADDPTSIVAELNDIFTNFDRITEQVGCERIKTIGDAYMAVSGLPDPNPDHGLAVAQAARLCVRYLKHRNQAHDVQWIARIGLASGPVIGSIVGVQKYVYDVFGPAVNLAARMERRCGPMEIVLCNPLAEKLQGDFALTSRGVEDIKGFGSMELYALGAPEEETA